MKRWICQVMIAVALSMSVVSAHAEQVLVAVAANFTSVMRQLVPPFEQQSGHRVKVSYGSTGKLYAQIQNGAPFELFLAADTLRPQKALREGLAVPDSGFTYAFGRLALWSAKAGLFDQSSGTEYLKQNAYPRLAIANPKTAPYGKAALEFLQGAGVWSEVKTRVVRGDSIAQTFQFVATGNAQLGFVALSQVKGWQGGQGSLWIPAAKEVPPIEQQAVLLHAGADSPAAIAFHAYLQSDQAKDIIKAAGYGVVDK